MPAIAADPTIRRQVMGREAAVDQLVAASLDGLRA